jgi:outer membrane protein OmpA-like peptidoglycan-associated protein
MAQRIGKCTNYSGCKLAYRNEKITVVTKDFRCPECGSPLESVGPKRTVSPILVLSIGVATVLILAIAAILWTLSSSPKRVTEVVELTPTSTSTPTPAPTATPTPTPSLTPTPTPTPSQASTPEPTKAPENLDLTGAEFDDVKKEIIKRIEIQPTATQAQKERAYAIIDKAKGMGRIALIKFDSANSNLRPQDVADVLGQVADPKVQKRLEDPTLVLVILGYADLQGNDQNNIELSRRRAQTVLDILRDKGGVANLMYPIPMGGSDLFGKREFSKNRVVEVWAVRP